MQVIALDTALGRCSVALWADGALAACVSEPMKQGHAERIAPMAREAMAQARLSFTDLDRIVVTVGPGSFTGVRVGLSFARGLALALKRPALGVSTLEALAEGEGAALIAAGAGVYAAIYAQGRPVLAPRRLGVEEARAALVGHVPVGPGAGAFGGVERDAPDVGALARRGAALDPALYPATPAYLRAPDAKPPEARR